ncbi:hypothetical protein Psal006b_02321 [Piscirickettsia salmonis]|nr:hypothetical protein Psal006b_02321 [Piscirickettsia salmonis]QGO84716.1 hypothetical protein Psal108_02316 [Piscirickettsia salmonis]QGO95210.1 hypothetical protein Psal111_02316 [Piscirickettsia salmonis]QGO98703.1 hypothetical protein Psal114_02318 [Piscirickettsia salmonis]QGP02190.1 hypothetical protein Psal117_02314 [Piscirickettsia salmonis]
MQNTYRGSDAYASNLDRTGPLLLLVILQELGFIEGIIKEIVINVNKGIKVYQTDEDVFIEECIEDAELYVDRPIVRVCKDNQEDSQLIQCCYESLRERPESLKRLPQQILLKLLSIYKEDAFPLIKMLIDQGQDIAEGNLRVVQGFLRQLGFLKKQDRSGESILTAALSSGNQQIVTEIIENICQLMPNVNLARGLFSGENKAKKELLVAKAGNGTPARVSHFEF